MTDDRHLRRVERTVTEVAGKDSVELLLVGPRTVWVVVDPDQASSDEVLIDLFSAITDVPRVETVRVERSLAAGLVAQ